MTHGAYDKATGRHYWGMSIVYLDVRIDAFRAAKSFTDSSRYRAGIGLYIKGPGIRHESQLIFDCLVRRLCHCASGDNRLKFAFRTFRAIWRELELPHSDDRFIILRAKYTQRAALYIRRYLGRYFVKNAVKSFRYTALPNCVCYCRVSERFSMKYARQKAFFLHVHWSDCWTLVDVVVK